MPELCRIGKLILKMQYNDTGKHNKPHFHAYYNEFSAVIGIDGELIEGILPSKQLKIVQGLAALREEELYKAWNKAVRGEEFEKIELYK